MGGGRLVATAVAVAWQWQVICAQDSNISSFSGLLSGISESNPFAAVEARRKRDASTPPPYSPTVFSPPPPPLPPLPPDLGLSSVLPPKTFPPLAEEGDARLGLHEFVAGDVHFTRFVVQFDMTVILEQQRYEGGTARTAERVGVALRYFEGQTTSDELAKSLDLGPSAKVLIKEHIDPSHSVGEKEIAVHRFLKQQASPPEEPEPWGGGAWDAQSPSKAQGGASWLGAVFGDKVFGAQKAQPAFDDYAVRLVGYW